MNAKEQQANQISRVDRAAAILDRALELNSTERDAYMEGACGDDVELRKEVEAMLRAHEEAGDFLAAPTNENAATIPSFPNEKPGTIIDRYKILQLIGEGGFGAVYMAEQREPVKRRVALKIIKLGMDTKQVIARFEAERQALAMMDHPNIARVFDAGATETGRPYFVMELVKGVPITEYCDTESLSTKDRLDIFINVCNAVQHAHQKGIIHRDIKPSNVMVTLHDGKPVPKVIDFGIAKATNRELTDKTLFTEYRQLIGTPQYMSPEQAEMSGLDIDTRSDIYSLGVLLYELLTGTTPFDPKRLRSAALGEIQRIIREEQPDKPSTRLSSLSAQGQNAPPSPLGRGVGGEGSAQLEQSSIHYIAKHRRTEPAQLSRELRGDLDWIIMKSLEKERARRYETANGLAADIQRHLSDEPVVASPPSASYRFRKFARRNKRLLGSITGIAAALIIGLTLATYGFITASNERDEKETARAEAEVVTDFLSDMLAAVEPGKQGKDVTVREVLDEASEKIAEKFADRPLIEARLRTTIGWAYYRLGHYSEAEPHLVRALDICQRLLGDEHPNTLSVMGNLAGVCISQGRYAEAEALCLETLESRKRVLGDEHPDTLKSMHHLATVYNSQGRYDEAERLFLEALELKKRVLGDEHPSTLKSMHNLANVYGEQGRYDEAEPLFLRALELHRRVLGEEHPCTLGTMTDLATLLLVVGRLDESEKLYRESLERKRRILGIQHPWTRYAIDGLATVYERQGRTDKALPLRRELLESATQFAHRPDADAVTINETAWMLLTIEPADLRDPDAALELARRGNDLTNYDNALYLDTLALAYHMTGDTAKAIETQQQALLALTHDQESRRPELQANLAKFQAALEQKKESQTGDE